MTDATGGSTRKTKLSVFVSLVAVIVALPTPTAVITPEDGLTVAAALLLDA